MKEAEYYGCIKEKIENLFSTVAIDVSLEITANGNFSQQLKQRIPRDREIIFYFLKKSAAPDITGFIQGRYSTDFVIIEVKKELKLDDIYQTEKYRDLFNSKCTFLVTLSAIPEEIKRICNLTWVLHGATIHDFFVLTQFDRNTGNFIEWYEENPFEKEFYWRRSV